MQIQLIAFDLDGTILKNNKTLSTRNREALFLAAKHNIYLVPSTGRPYAGIPSIIRNLPKLRYAITTNGAQVYDSLKKETLYRAEMTKTEVQHIFAYVTKCPGFLSCFANNIGFMDSALLNQLQEYGIDTTKAHMMNEFYTPMDRLQDNILQKYDSIQKIQIDFPDSQIKEEYMNEMQVLFPGYSITSSLPNLIEINSNNANKGNALRFLCNHLQIPLNNSVAFGDGNNDIELLTNAGIGIAMANAGSQSVFDAANQTTMSNEDDGVAHAIESLLMQD